MIEHITSSAILHSVEAARIILHPPINLTELAGNTVRLVCSATGVPTPTVVWSNATGPITNDSSYKIYSQVTTINDTEVTTSVLEICDVRVTSAGQYRCTSGNDSITVNLQVNGNEVGLRR